MPVQCTPAAPAAAPWHEHFLAGATLFRNALSVSLQHVLGERYVQQNLVGYHPVKATRIVCCSI